MMCPHGYPLNDSHAEPCYREGCYELSAKENPMREGWVTTHRIGDAQIGVPLSAIMGGPHVTWKHVDGPLMTWAGELHWLTFRERLRIFFRRATVDQIACERWPHLAKLRKRSQEIPF
jgi:hypothetical protein